MINGRVRVRLLADGIVLVTDGEGNLRLVIEDVNEERWRRMLLAIPFRAPSDGCIPWSLEYVTSLEFRPSGEHGYVTSVKAPLEHILAVLPVVGEG